MSTVLYWQDHAERLFPHGANQYLDYGCGRGGLIRRVLGKAARIWGVDVDPEVLPSIPGVSTVAIREGELLPFPDDFFDVITCLEVIEHVSDERATFSELKRVLRPGGCLLLTTPHKGWLTWLDPGNVKFIAPSLHRTIHRVLRTKDYTKKFGRERREELGMISDISANQAHPWHRHYRYKEIRRLAPESLRTELVEIRFPGMRACWCLQILWRSLTGKDARWISALMAPLSRWQTPAGDQLLVMFRKQA